MSSITRTVRTYKKLLANNGFHVDEVITNKHIKVKASYNGRQTTFTLPVTASDRRALLNVRADILRTRRQIDGND